MAYSDHLPGPSLDGPWTKLGRRSLLDETAGKLLYFVTMKAQWLIFASELVIDWNQTRAYMVAYPDSSKEAAGSSSHELLKNPKIREMVYDALMRRIAETGVQANDVVHKLLGTINADPNELIEIRRDCCRHCYGENNRYQYTMGEWDAVLVRHQRDAWAAQAVGKIPPPDPDPRGGIGFNRRLPPNPICPECFGEGIEDYFVKDTRYLSPAARELYAGVKITKNGIEIQKHSRDKALELLGRHLAMFTDNVDHKNNGGTFKPMSLSEFYAKPETDTESGAS